MHILAAILFLLFPMGILPLSLKQIPFLNTREKSLEEQSAAFFEEDQSKSIQFCSSQDDIFQPLHVALSPDPPVRGEQLTIVLNGSLNAQLTQGSIAHVTIKLGFIKLLDRDYDVCENAGEIEKECPVEKGPLDIVKIVDIPAQAPPGRYRIHVDAYLPGGRPITCIGADFRM